MASCPIPYFFVIFRELAFSIFKEIDMTPEARAMADTYDAENL